MPEITQPNTCPNEDCGGSGYIDDDPCPTCFGTGSLPIKGEMGRTLKKLKVMEDKTDSIIIEQASQRTDLTAALTQIWNKVKDL